MVLYGFPMYILICCALVYMCVYVYVHVYAALSSLLAFGHGEVALLHLV